MLKTRGRLTPRIEERLRARLRAGDETARDEKIAALIPLAVYLGETHLGAGQYTEDLVGEALLVLVRVVRGFDPSSPTPLLVLAARKIRYALYEASLRMTAPLRIPRGQHELLRDVAAARRDVAQREKRPATRAAIERALGFPPGALDYALTRAGRGGPESYPVEDEDRQVFPEVERRGAAPSPEALVLSAEQERRTDNAVAELRANVARLPRKAREVVRLRFGLDGADRQTVAEVAARLGACKATVTRRQREAFAILGSRAGA